MFALNWQRQADLERERQAVLDEGELIENDTQFAFEYDKKRERQDNKQLALLKRMVRCSSQQTLHLFLLIRCLRSGTGAGYQDL